MAMSLIRNHPNYNADDYAYLRGIGYTDAERQQGPPCPRGQ